MRFRVKAMRGMSEVAVFPVEAVDEADARLHAQRQGYAVIAVAPDRGITFGGFAKRVDFPVIRFTQELIALLKAGLTLVESLEILHRKEVQPAHKILLQDLLKRLQQGGRFSQALEAYPLVFSPLYAATVRASERTGAIQDALGRYVDYQAQIERVRSKVISASIYPALLLLIGGLVALFLLGYVVPRFSRVYHDLGDKLPLLSQWLMQWGQAIDQHGGWVLGGLLGMAAIAYYVFMQPETRARALGMLWRLPILKPQRRIYELAQFYRTMGMLLRSGLPLLTALEMAKTLLSPEMQVNLDRAALQVKEGGSFAEAMRANDLTTIVAHSMMMVAERSGNLAEMLDVVASFHDEELARWVDWFTRLFEPILMAVIGIIIGLIVVFMYMPIFELAEVVQ
jgi:general secretion pathway protein F